MKNVLGVKLYTLEEIAELLSVRTATISKYIQQGKIKSVKIGQRKYINEQALKDFILNDK